MLLSSVAGTCRARRHWNSPSYRTAAGNVPFGESYAKVNEADGAEGSRTPDLCSAIAALSQLSYSPLLERATFSFIRSHSGPLTTRPRSRGAGRRHENYPYQARSQPTKPRTTRSFPCNTLRSFRLSD